MHARFKLQVAGRSDVGQRRSNNQDSFLINDTHGLFAIADGMGGHSGGEVASALAVKTLERVFIELAQNPIRARLEQAAILANQVIFEQSRASPHLQGMGTTLTACALDGDHLQIVQVGDSRLYLFRDGNLFQITEDHSQVYELLKAGVINEASTDLFQKNVITRSVGYEKEVAVDVFTRVLERGDRYLLCSDGLSGMVSAEDIARILGNFRPQEAVVNLVDLANANGGEDNVSVIVVDVE